MRNNASFWGALTAIGLLLILAIGIGLGYYLDEPKTEIPTVTVDVGAQASPNEPEVELDLDNEYEKPDAQEAAQPVREEDLTVHEDLRDETPPGVDQADVEKIEESDPANLTEPLPVGGAQNYSCPNHFVRNFSDRAPGTHVSIFVLHYTVSRPGSLNAIRALFDRPSFGASSSLGLEPSGRCETWVPFNKKAWTQGAFNSVAESVEIMAMGTEPRSWWLAQPIIKNEILASIVVDRLRARGIPPRRVDPVGCNVQNAGWTDHNALECGNTHHDVAPNFPYDVFQRQVVKRYNAGQASMLPGPRPKPAWFWQWCNWVIGGREDVRPENAPLPIPDWGWDACGKWIENH